MMALRAGEVSWWWCCSCWSAKARTAAAPEHAASVRRGLATSLPTAKAMLPSLAPNLTSLLTARAADMATTNVLIVGVRQTAQLRLHLDRLTCS